MRASASIRRPQSAYGPMSSLLSGCAILLRRSRREPQRLGDIVVPAVDVGPELDARAVPECGLVEQPHRDSASAA